MTLKLTVEHVRDETETVRVMRLVGYGLPDWDAGAHLEFMLPVGSRSYSLIDWTGTPGPTYEIAVKLEDQGDGGSAAMHALAIGDEIHAEAPKNDFPLSEGPALLIAGGIGITPLISMAATLQARGTDFALHYAAQSRADMAFQARLTEMCGDALTCHFDDEEAINLRSVITPGRAVYICGPKGMIEAAREICLEIGIPADQIHFELFTTEMTQDGDAAFEVVVQDTGDVFTIPPGKSIIEVLEEGGVDLVYDCQRGDCGICQVDVVEGIPDHRDVVLSKAERESGKMIQICVSRSLTPRLVLDL